MKTFTEEELHAALQRMKVAPPPGITMLTQKIIDSIEKNRAEKDSSRQKAGSTEGQPETLTVDELTAALWSLTNAGKVSDRNAVTLATMIMDDVHEHRESYDIGHVYKDARGEYYKRLGTGWLRFGSMAVVPLDEPRRPLEKA